MTNIYERFMALPRARKGTTTVVIVEEAELANLIAAAQTSEALLFGAQHARVGIQVHNGGSSEPVNVVHYDPPQPPPAPMAVLVEEPREWRGRRQRRVMGVFG